MKAKLIIDRDFQIGVVDPRLYSSFLEHIGRAIYSGIYEPGHPMADADGIRKDVMGLIDDLSITAVRYPGGNYVSGFNWEDSIGPKEKRPERLDLAWFTTESNQFGLHEFIDWCRKAHTQPMIAVNLGTRGPADAQNLIEYTNHPGGSLWSDLRKKNGMKEPMDIKLWCLGNEMDGPWQIGHKTAGEYARIAHETAKLLKWVDPSIEVVACGSSNRQMATYGHWERKVLEECYDVMDYISLHQYYRMSPYGTADFLAQSMDMDCFITEVIAMCDAVKGRKRSRKTINLSFDEWNVWYHTRPYDAELKKSSRRWEHELPLDEDIYTFEDALLTGSMLLSLLRHVDRVKIACLAQLVNVIAPIFTRRGGPCWKQTTYYPFLHLSKYGRGNALQVLTSSACYSSHNYDDVPYVDTAAVYTDDGNINVFCVNRNLEEPINLTLDMRSFGAVSAIEHICMISDNLQAVNREDNPGNVAPHKVHDIEIDGGTASVALPKASWNVLRFSTDHGA